MEHRTIQERGYCTRSGYARLDQVLGQLCELGNAALQEHRDAWKRQRERISYQDQCRSLTLVRRDDPDGLGKLNVAAGRGALQRVDRAFQGFFRRCKQGGKPGDPRFRSRRRYSTIEINDVGPGQVPHHDTCTLVKVDGLPTVRLRPHRPLPETKPRTIRIVRRATGCSVDLVYEHAPEPLGPTGATIGIEDLRVSNLTRSTKGTCEAPGRNVRARAGLNRSILEQSWGLIHDRLVYKAAWACRQLIEVNPKFTSQDCSAYGVRRSTPDGHEHGRCEHCNTEHDRDINAAVNIHRAGIEALGSQSSGRAAA